VLTEWLGCVLGNEEGSNAYASPHYNVQSYCYKRLC
jgi:hypothetical protein